MINLSVSKLGYDTKQNCYNSIEYEYKSISLDEFYSFIRSGHIFNKNYGREEFQINFSTSESFISADYLFYDLDDVEEDNIFELVDGLALKPTIAYTTFNHKVKGNRFRLVYVFDESVTSVEEYRYIYKYLKKTNQIELKDDCGYSPFQNMWGSNDKSEFYEEYVSNGLICIKEILNGRKDDVLEKKCNREYIKKEKKNIIQSELHFSEDDTFLHDYWSLPFSDFIHKYSNVYPFFDSTPLPQVSDDIPFIVLPSNYYQIQRPFVFIYNADNEMIGTRIRKLKDGENRKKKLYLNGLLRKKMIPEIPFNHLLFCLNYELYYFIDNRKDIIDKKILYNIALNAYKADESKYEFKKDKRKFMVNKAYTAKYGVKANSIKNSFCKMHRFEVIQSVFDCSAKQSDLLNEVNEILSEEGFKTISKRTFMNDLKELSIQKKQLKS